MIEDDYILLMIFYENSQSSCKVKSEMQHYLHDSVRHERV